MQIKTILIASLAAVGQAAMVEKRQNILSDIASGLESQLPNAILTQLPSNIQQIYSQVTAFLPAITALPPSLISEIETVLATLPTSEYQSFFSSIVSQLPPGFESSLLGLGSSLTSEVAGLTSDLTVPTAGPSITSSGPSATATGPSTGSMVTETSASQTTSMGSSSTGSQTGSRTSSAPGTSSTPNAGSRTFVGLSVLGVTGILGLALAL